MPTFRPNRRPAMASGFTLVEAVVAIAVMAIAGAALLAGLAGSLQTTQDTVERTVAQGLARQMMDEVLGSRYVEYGDYAYSTSLGPEGSESSLGSRGLYDDMDDFNGVVNRPPVDTWRIELGADDGEGGSRNPSFCIPDGRMDRWREEVSVYYVSPTDLTTRLSAGRVSDYRAVEVRVFAVDANGGSRQMAKLCRVVVYVPPL